SGIGTALAGQAVLVIRHAEPAFSHRLLQHQAERGEGNRLDTLLPAPWAIGGVVGVKRVQLATWAGGGAGLKPHCDTFSAGNCRSLAGLGFAAVCGSCGTWANCRN